MDFWTSCCWEVFSKNPKLIIAREVLPGSKRHSDTKGHNDPVGKCFFQVNNKNCRLTPFTPMSHFSAP